ncbi:hypothetical protein DAERI_010063 [Deinococcus aerius]|uniref:NurA domain-containing protein n=1 Tax=Deinococcus aerius TaxID=200253 RepID=A0A2I9DGZ0_9DEIO|nr:DNA double-strand break repair nuclease NurA [Deinococcus aerius]GBF03891.1 hypothetical protein DAERI_010063 [Deinococcus aerius]
MPYSNEFAQHKILGHFTENPEVKKLIESLKDPEFPEDTRAGGRTDIPRRDWKPRWVIAIDGSHQEIPYEKGFPGAELGFVSVASVLINVELLIAESDKPTIDPVAFNRVQSANTLTAALPSTNMIRKSFTDARTSFRAAWKDLLENTRPAAKSETLLETYQALLKYKPTERDQKCPLMDACGEKDHPSPNYAAGTCGCGKFPVYPTDILRIHERFSDHSSNGESFGEVMRVLEHLYLVAYLRHMERVCRESGNWGMFEDTAIVMDGSLAVFGHPAWLSQAIKKELARINGVVREKTGGDILVFGIEKSGRFFDHWVRLDTKSKADFDREREEDEDPDAFPAYQAGRLTKQAVLLPDDGYIKKYVVPSVSDKPWGKDTYYGRPFLYKTRTGAMIVGISAILAAEQDERSTAEPGQFPRLGDMLDLLDLLVSMRYPNAIIPLIAAHAEAAIPLQMGEKVLDKLAREHIGKAIP